MGIATSGRTSRPVTIRNAPIVYSSVGSAIASVELVLVLAHRQRARFAQEARARCAPRGSGTRDSPRHRRSGKPSCIASASATSRCAHSAERDEQRAEPLAGVLLQAQRALEPAASSLPRAIRISPRRIRWGAFTASAAQKSTGNDTMARMGSIPFSPRESRPCVRFSGEPRPPRRPRAPICPKFDTHLIAFYLPQFHPIPENDAWWGKGFTEWRSVVRRALSLPVTISRSSRGSRVLRSARAGDACRAGGARARNTGSTASATTTTGSTGAGCSSVRSTTCIAAGKPDFPFCVCWANENWTRRWDGHDDDILVAQQYFGPTPIGVLPRSSRRLFRDARYIRVHERPLFVVYRAGSLPDPRGFAERCPRAGDDATGSPTRSSPTRGLPDLPPPGDWGFDAAIEFPPHRLRSRRGHASRSSVASTRSRGEGLGLRADREVGDRSPPPDYRLFRGVMTGCRTTHLAFPATAMRLRQRASGELRAVA